MGFPIDADLNKLFVVPHVPILNRRVPDGRTGFVNPTISISQLVTSLSDLV